jgi:hypothetical protein
MPSERFRSIAVSARANPADAGCDSDLAQYSITPRGRIRGQPVRRSFLRSLVGSSVSERSRKNEAPCERAPSRNGKPRVETLGF